MVTVTVSNDCSTESYSEIVTIEEVSSVEEAEEITFSLTPTLADEVIVVEFPSLMENYSLQVYDVEGRMMFQRNINKGDEAIRIDSWNAGVYYLVVKGETEEQSTKVFYKF